MKRKIKIAVWLLVILGIIAALKYADYRFKQQKIDQIIIDIDINGAAPLISEDEVRALIQHGHDSLHKQKVGEVDLQMIENLIRTNPYVLSANAYINMDATLEIKVVQRIPVMRIFNTKGESYYLDAQGVLLPLHPNSSIYVPVASGNIHKKYEPSMHLRIFDTITEDQCPFIYAEEKLLHMATFISRDSLLSQLIAQVYVKDQRHFEMVPRLGTQKIIFGDAFDTKEKLLKLKYFYQEAFRKYDVSVYSAFDLRFRNQIVCVKK